MFTSAKTLSRGSAREKLEFCAHNPRNVPKTIKKKQGMALPTVFAPPKVRPLPVVVRKGVSKKNLLTPHFLEVLGGQKTLRMMTLWN